MITAIAAATDALGTTSSAFVEVCLHQLVAAARLFRLSVLFQTRKRALVIGDIEVFIRRVVCDATFKLGALGIILR